jgi:hypothetical protein
MAIPDVGTGVTDNTEVYSFSAANSSRFDGLFTAEAAPVLGRLLTRPLHKPHNGMMMKSEINKAFKYEGLAWIHQDIAKICI